jgi:hypothetical protein
MLPFRLRRKGTDQVNLLPLPFRSMTIVRMFGEPGGGKNRIYAMHKVGTFCVPDRLLGAPRLNPHST